MPDHNVVFYGVLCNYAVAYDLDGGILNGSGTVNPKMVGWNDAGLLPAGTPAKSGMRLVGPMRTLLLLKPTGIATLLQIIL